MNNIKLIFLFLIFVNSILYSQEEQNKPKEKDSLDISKTDLILPNSILRDWRIFNYPFVLSTLGYSPFSSPLSFGSSPHNLTASKEELLAQFRSQQNWGGNKKFSTFTEYLGYAQFLGAMGLLGVHIYQWSNLKNAPAVTPGKSFNRYDFKK